MANDYTNTAEHYLPVPAITDKFSFTRDIVNIRERVNQGMRGLLAYNASANNYVLAATNAGKFRSSVDGEPYGRVGSKTNGADPTWTFQLNNGSVLADSWSAGVDDSDSDAFKIEGAATLGATPEFRLAKTTGDLTLKGNLAFVLLKQQSETNALGWASAGTSSLYNTLHRYIRRGMVVPVASAASIIKADFGTTSGWEPLYARITFMCQYESGTAWHIGGMRQCVFAIQGGVMVTGAVQTLGTDSAEGTPPTITVTALLTQNPDTIAFQVQAGSGLDC